MSTLSIGRAANGARRFVALVVLAFMATRMKIKVNGTDGGKLLRIQEGWGAADLINTGGRHRSDPRGQDA